MSMQSELARVEVRIDWHDDGAQHRNREHFDKVNFWRDIFPGALSLRLPDSDGDWISEDFAAGELVPPWSQHNVHRVRHADLHLTRNNGPTIRIDAGRYYPGYIAAGIADIFAGNMQPLRVVELDGDMVTLDLNHPLSRAEMTVATRILERLGPASEHGGRCNDVVMDALAAGVGLETLHPAAAGTSLAEMTYERIDGREDGQFYSTPRLVQHIDSTAIGQVRDFYRQHLAAGMQVLDFMSSWVSHLPDDVDGLSVTGLGMNEAELQQNPQLASYHVQDVNATPALPFTDDRFDAVVCSMSVEYLVHPVANLQQLARVLRPGGQLLVTFSDRWFPTKVITLWTELHPFERLALVQAWLRDAGFSDIGTETVRGLPRPGDDKYAQQRAFSDPVFMVRAVAA